MVKSEARSQRIPLLWVDSLSGGLPLESRAPGWEEARATCRGHVEASRVTAWDPRMSMGAGPSLATSTGHQPPGRWILAALQPKSRYSVMLQTRMSKFQYSPRRGGQAHLPEARLQQRHLVCSQDSLVLTRPHREKPAAVSRALTTVLLPFQVIQKLRIRLDFLFHPSKHKGTPSLPGN